MLGCFFGLATTSFLSGDVDLSTNLLSTSEVMSVIELRSEFASQLYKDLCESGVLSLMGSAPDRLALHTLLST